MCMHMRTRIVNTVQTSEHVKMMGHSNKIYTRAFTNAQLVYRLILTIFSTKGRTLINCPNKTTTTFISSEKINYSTTLR
jgi:hypothetical protein